MRDSVAMFTALVGLVVSLQGPAAAIELPPLPGSLVPAQGEGLFSEVIGPDGVARSTLLAPRPPAISSEASDASGEITACMDDAHSLWGWRESEPHAWYFNPYSVPSSVNPAAALGAVKRATDTVTTAANSCTRGDSVAASAVYHGATFAGTNIGRSGGCLARDGRSVVAFGPLDNGALAYACVWFSTQTSPWEVVESDIRLNSGTYSWFVDRPIPCASRYDLESVLAHERGHTFGLGHVSEAGHGSLTMSERVSACSTSARTLGLGDVLGLERLY